MASLSISIFNIVLLSRFQIYTNLRGNVYTAKENKCFNHWIALFVNNIIIFMNVYGFISADTSEDLPENTIWY